MNTLSDLKRYLQKGTTVKSIFNRWRDTNVNKLREVTKVQSNGVYFIDPENPKADSYRLNGKGSFLEFPPASLIAVDEKGFKIFCIGERPLNKKEFEIIANEPRDEKQEEIDMLTDGNAMFWRRKGYYNEVENGKYKYLFTPHKNGKGVRHKSGVKVVTDPAIMGELSLEYEFVNLRGK